MPNKAVEQLDKEVSSLKQDHLQSLIKEQVRANQAEEQLKKIKQVEESRVAELGKKSRTVLGGFSCNCLAY